MSYLKYLQSPGTRSAVAVPYSKQIGDVKRLFKERRSFSLVEILDLTLHSVVLDVTLMLEIGDNYSVGLCPQQIS